jgi:hypothetical protein
MAQTIFSKEYSGEGLCDVERDVAEAFDPDFNHRVIDIPNDEHELPKGVFTVTITWEEDESSEL